MNEGDKEIQCKRKGAHCEGSFIYTLRDQEFYREKGYGAPKNCKPCRVEIKAEVAAAKERRGAGYVTKGPTSSGGD